ncbi:MAG: hypothetical protein Q7R32_01755 [Dehalococcoidia bacterium]|nr:hypothetical protein [Dehalococcoidia bacterium]
MPTIKKAIVKSYSAATHKATVQVAGSLGVWLDSIRVATDIPAADVVAGRQCTVLFLDPANQDDAVVLCIQGALPSTGAILQATATADLTLTTSAQSIVGDGDSSKVRLLLPTPGDWEVEATCDLNHTAAGANLAVGQLHVNDSGTAETADALLEQSALRATVVQRWKITTTATNIPVELKARKTAAGGTAICRATNTRLTASGVQRATGGDGGGVTDHALLTNLLLSASGHTGPISNTQHGIVAGAIATVDHTALAALAGRAGGQTLHGGPATTEKLILKGNSVDAAPYTQTFGYHELTGVDDPDGSGQIEIGVLRSLGTFGGLDVIYLIPTGIGQPITGDKNLTFPVGFASRRQSQVYSPENTVPGQILTVQPLNNNAIGSGSAVFGQFFSGGAAAAQLVRGLRYEVGTNTGAGSMAELTGCLVGIRTTLTGLPTTDAAYFRGNPFVWDAATVLTTIYGIVLPEITRGVNRWGGGRARDCTANAGTYAYGWQVDEFIAGVVTNQWPFYYGAPLAANRGKFSVDRFGSIHTDAELATAIGNVTLVNGANNHNVTILPKSFLRIAGPTAAFSISGIAGGFDGKRLTIYNPTGHVMTITNEDAASVAANRIITMTGGARATTAAGVVELIYSATDSRWLVTGFEA